MQDVQNFYKATERQLFQLVEWAKHIPHFTSLPIKDQVLLLRAGELYLQVISLLNNIVPCVLKCQIFYVNLFNNSIYYEKKRMKLVLFL